MWCPQCGTDTRVLETDKLGETVTRVRWCRNGGCRFLFETHEVLLKAPPGEGRPGGAPAPGAPAAARGDMRPTPGAQARASGTPARPGQSGK
jgi:hypothetical protein